MANRAAGSDPAGYSTNAGEFRDTPIRIAAFRFISVAWKSNRKQTK
jgi:hypothetical protein